MIIKNAAYCWHDTRWVLALRRPHCLWHHQLEGVLSHAGCQAAQEAHETDQDQDLCCVRVLGPVAEVRVLGPVAEVQGLQKGISCSIACQEEAWPTHKTECVHVS